MVCGFAEPPRKEQYAQRHADSSGSEWTRRCTVLDRLSGRGKGKPNNQTLFGCMLNDYHIASCAKDRVLYKFFVILRVCVQSIHSHNVFVALYHLLPPILNQH